MDKLPPGALDWLTTPDLRQPTLDLLKTTPDLLPNSRFAQQSTPDFRPPIWCGCSLPERGRLYFSGSVEFLSTDPNIYRVCFYVNLVFLEAHIKLVWANLP